MIYSRKTKFGDNLFSNQFTDHPLKTSIDLLARTSFDRWVIRFYNGLTELVVACASDLLSSRLEKSKQLTDLTDFILHHNWRPISCLFGLDLHY